MGTMSRSDDTIGGFSSRGATAIDAGAKPDIVAPGVGIESLSDPGSALYGMYSAFLLPGTVATSYLPYLSLSGTSMAAPVVSGTVALMLQANPSLTPNLVKAILEYTSEVYPAYDPLTEGAGFLNAGGAVALARYLAGAAPYPDSTGWSGRFIWGNYLIQGGTLSAAANAWSASMPWGGGKTSSGQTVTWGEICSGGTCSPWGAACANWLCTRVSYGAAPNVVWGSTCDGSNCSGTWTGAGQVNGAMVVWGTSSTESDIVVWGTTCSDPSCTPVMWTRP
jgi:hypothetical protein